MDKENTIMSLEVGNLRVLMSILVKVQKSMLLTGTSSVTNAMLPGLVALWGILSA